MAPDTKADLLTVLTQVQTSRANLSLEDGSTKATTLAQDLSDAWESPKAETYETDVYDIVSAAATTWRNIEATVQEEYDNAPSDTEEE